MDPFSGVVEDFYNLVVDGNGQPTIQSDGELARDEDSFLQPAGGGS